MWRAALQECCEDASGVLLDTLRWSHRKTAALLHKLQGSLEEEWPLSFVNLTGSLLVFSSMTYTAVQYPGLWVVTVNHLTMKSRFLLGSACCCGVLGFVASQVVLVAYDAKPFRHRRLIIQALGRVYTFTAAVPLFAHFALHSSLMRYVLFFSNSLVALAAWKLLLCAQAEQGNLIRKVMSRTSQDRFTLALEGNAGVVALPDQEVAVQWRAEAREHARPSPLCGRLSCPASFRALFERLRARLSTSSGHGARGW
eukprot:CAMPEP_0171098612 /NCGR_PEP_ID=MMETSP0766_2-20121228/48861_1 /TAXON_ID=439317 /ORGANISM="Gambierdiscus australes, Strain CAWD 149" /LENGTH=254 /DNA_ID=CAMNT_0011558001 /DNA_START=36 /DNA_END=798 /DNA_ORIENTATION=-